MYIDALIQKWQDKHTELLDEYSKGNTNAEVMKIYRSRMEDILDIISDLKVASIKRKTEPALLQNILNCQTGSFMTEMQMALFIKNRINLL